PLHDALPIFHRAAIGHADDAFLRAVLALIGLQAVGAQAELVVRACVAHVARRWIPEAPALIAALAGQTRRGGRAGRALGDRDRRGLVLGLEIVERFDDDVDDAVGHVRRNGQRVL